MSRDMVEVSIRSVDEREENKILQFLGKTCKCSIGPGESPCSTLYDVDQIATSRNNIAEFTNEERDLFVLAYLRSSLNTGTSTPVLRVHDRRVCQKTFLFLHAIGQKTFLSLLQHYKLNRSISSRIHGNYKRLPSNAFNMNDINYFINFMQSYAIDNGCKLPGNHPGHRDIDIVLLPTASTKREVWKKYDNICKQFGTRCLSYPSFARKWKTLIPYIKIMRKKSDLCWTCLQYDRNSLVRNKASPEIRTSLETAHEEHLRLAKRGRTVYNQMKEDARDTFKRYVNDRKKSGKTMEGDWLTDAYNKPCSFDGRMHYSFDYAQNLQFPADPQQPGPIYFKVPRRCSLFGVCSEGAKRQVNFMIDESVQVTKGPNAVISYFHSCLERHGLGETHMNSHADNCSGQNKNNPMLQYLAWRVIVGLHIEILLCFLIAGHTKFSADGHFGNIKIKTGRTSISSLGDIAKCIVESTPETGANIAEPVGLTNGETLIPTLDWSGYFEPFFKKLPKLKRYQYFRFHRDYPGTVFCREEYDSDEIAVNILRKAGVLPKGHPDWIKPQGLSEDRKNYLRNEIRQFCRPGTEDLVCP